MQILRSIREVFAIYTIYSEDILTHIVQICYVSIHIIAISIIILIINDTCFSGTCKPISGCRSQWQWTINNNENAIYIYSYWERLNFSETIQIFKIISFGNNQTSYSIKSAFKFVSMWDVNEMTQGQAGLSFITSVGGVCTHWAFQWQNSHQSHTWSSHDEYSIHDIQQQKQWQVHNACHNF